MKITDIKFGMLRVPLKTPFKTALRTVDTVEDIVVIVHTDTGHVGYGEAPATAVITGDTHGSIVEAVGKFIRPRLIGQDIANLNRITDLIQTALERNTSAKAAVEIAVYDLWAQLYDAPLYKMLGGGDPVITTDITISVDYIDKMVADSISAVERGFESLKIKVGKDIGLDIERVKAIYSAVEGRALLRLDANQGWTAKQAVFAMQHLEDAGVVLELLEQPVKARDLDGLKYVTDRVHTPVMADESVFGPTEVIDLIKMRAADIINIKLMKTGGLSRAIHAAVEGRALLRLDANQGWTAKQAVFALQQLEDAGVHLELVEQPVKASDLSGLKFVTERVHTPVMADESVFGPSEVIELIRLRAADIINIKLMKTGGLSGAIQIADIAAVHGMECMMGCMLESSVSVAAAAHLAAAKSQVITKIDLDGPSLCLNDPVIGDTVFNEAEITLGTRPGFGVSDVPGLLPVKGD